MVGGEGDYGHWMRLLPLVLFAKEAEEVGRIGNPYDWHQRMLFGAARWFDLSFDVLQSALHPSLWLLIVPKGLACKRSIEEVTNLI